MTNTQEFLTVLGKKRCKYCFSLIDEKTERCKKMCWKATQVKKMDELKDEIEALKNK